MRKILIFILILSGCTLGQRETRMDLDGVYKDKFFLDSNRVYAINVNEIDSLTDGSLLYYSESDSSLYALRTDSAASGQYLTFDAGGVPILTDSIATGQSDSVAYSDSSGIADTALYTQTIGSVDSATYADTAGYAENYDGFDSFYFQNQSGTMTVLDDDIVELTGDGDIDISVGTSSLTFSFTNGTGYITDPNDDVSASELDGVFSATGLLKRTGAAAYSTITDNSSNWNTAYGWGDHSTQGYITDGNTGWDNVYNLFDKDFDILESIQNVNTTNVQNGDVLYYNSSLSEWRDTTTTGLSEIFVMDDNGRQNQYTEGDTLKFIDGYGIDNLIYGDAAAGSGTAVRVAPHVDTSEISTKWYAENLSYALDDLSDVAADPFTTNDGDILQYNNTSGDWETTAYTDNVGLEQIFVLGDGRQNTYDPGDTLEFINGFGIEDYMVFGDAAAGSDTKVRVKPNVDSTVIATKNYVDNNDTKITEDITETFPSNPDVGDIYTDEVNKTAYIYLGGDWRIIASW